MEGLFGDQTEAAVLQSIQALRQSQILERDRELEMLSNYYAGGDLVAQYITQHEGEEKKDWEKRKENYTNANYVGLFANKLIDGSFGGDVYRSFDGATPKQNETLTEVFADADMEEVYAEVGQGTVVHGDGWGMVDVDETEKSVVVHPVHTGDINYAVDPYRKTRVTELLERRWLEKVNGEDVFEYLAWGTQPTPWVQVFDNDGRPKSEREPNRVGLIPYARFKGRSVIGELDGYSYIRDQISLQRDLINLFSELGLLIKYQSGSLLVIQDHESPEAGVGPRAGLRLSADGEAYFLAPNAAIKDVMEVAREKVNMMFETGSVPAEVVQTRATDDSGIALEIRFRPFTRLVGRMRKKQMIGDRNLVRAVCATYNTHIRQGTFPAADRMRPIIEYRDSIVPQDTERELDTDLRLVTGRPALMTRKTFLTRHMARFGLRDAKDVDRYLEELQSDEARAAAFEQSRFGGDLGGSRLFGNGVSR